MKEALEETEVDRAGGRSLPGAMLFVLLGAAIGYLAGDRGWEAVPEQVVQQSDALEEMREESSPTADEDEGRSLVRLLLVASAVVVVGYVLRGRFESPSEALDVATERLGEATEEPTERAGDVAERVEAGGEEAADRIEEGGENVAERVEPDGDRMEDDVAEETADRLEEAAEAESENEDEDTESDDR